MNIIRGLEIYFFGAVVAVQSSLGAPLDDTHVAKNAMWLAHIDMERLMQASFSEMAVDHLKEAIAENNDSMVSVDIDRVLAELKSITAYGTKIGPECEMDSVMVLEAGDKLQTIIDGFLAHQELMEEGDVNFEVLEDKPFKTYLFESELFVAYPRVGLVIASKNFERIEEAYDVITGDADNLTQSKNGLVLNSSDDFFLLASAAGLDQLKDMPPQARILQKTKGGQLSFGEIGDDFRASLILSTASREVSEQLHRILQGMVALASFTQVENQNIMEIVENIEVKLGDDWVSLDISYPVESFMRLMTDAMKENSDDGSAGGEDSSGEQSAYEPEYNWRKWESLYDPATEDTQRMLVARNSNE